MWPDKQMSFSSNWDGTISQSDFYQSARALQEKWETTHPGFLPWTWVSSPRPFGVAAREAQGYLSLEQYTYPRAIEVNSGDAILGEEELPAYTTKEELTDNATLVHSYDRDVHLYDLHIVHNASYRVPVLYFRGYHCDGQPLSTDDIEKDLPYHLSKILKDSRWTFMTLEEHPYLNRPWYVLHPCGTSEWMKFLLLGDASVLEDGEIIKHYLLSWLSVVGQVFGLRVPLDIFKTPRTVS